MIKPINRNKITETVFNEMMEMIISGQWKIDERIPSEHELSERFQVSRNSIKQAIHRIAALGLLEAKQGDGTFVRMMDISSYMNLMLPTVLLGSRNVLKLFEFQQGLQNACVKLACRKRTAEQIEALTEYIEKMRVYQQAEDVEGFLESDLMFHTIIAQMSQNELYIKATELVEKLLFYSLTRIVLTYDSTQSIKFHTSIRDSIEKQDEATASKLMEAHLSDVIYKLETVVPGEE